METRRFGRTGHMSTVAILGCFVFNKSNREETDRIMQKVMEHRVNHLDIAPTYGIAEELMAPWIEKYRQNFFVCCKTRELTKQSAQTQLHQSLAKLKAGYFDLYSIHSVRDMQVLDKIFAPDGALAALIDAKKEGLIKHIGITGHRFEIVAVLLEALRRFDFDAINFPLNFIQFSNEEYKKGAQELLHQCRQKDVGVMVMKAMAKSAFVWEQTGFNTMYQPWTEAEDIQRAVNFALSQDITGLCTLGEPSLLPQELDACENFKPLSPEEQLALIEEGKKYPLIFAKG